MFIINHANFIQKYFVYFGVSDTEFKEVFAIVSWIKMQGQNFSPP